jgi:hypothetical protein
MTSRVSAFLLLFALAACRAPGDDAPRAQPPAARGSASAPAADSVLPAHVFDPARVQVGDSIAGLRIDTVDVWRAMDGAWVGMVRFAGEVRLGGTYEPHPDPEANLLCFFAGAEHAERLPRFHGDERRPWFCFADQDRARALLPVPPGRGRAEIVVDRFTYHFAYSDVVNSARLVRVVTRVPLAEARDSGG